MIEWKEKQLNIQNEGLMLLYLYTPMCGTCQLAKRMIQVVEELLPTLEIQSVNLNFYPNEAMELEIESVPCLLVIRDGEVKEKIYAFQSVGFLYETLKAFV